MAGFNFDRIQHRADSLISRFGGKPNNARLRRDGLDRPCTCVIIEYTPREKGLRLEGSKRALVSRFDPTTRQPLELPPDHEKDLLVFPVGVAGVPAEVHRLVAPDEGPRPNGVPVYHDLPVVYSGLDKGPSDNYS